MRNVIWSGLLAWGGILATAAIAPGALKNPYAWGAAVLFSLSGWVSGINFIWILGEDEDA